MGRRRRRPSWSCTDIYVFLQAVFDVLLAEQSRAEQSTIGRVVRSGFSWQPAETRGFPVPAICLVMYGLALVAQLSKDW